MRKPVFINCEYDIVVVGGGLAGVCAAVAAARLGAKVALVQDRPVLGGNSSSEIRVPIGGADYNGKYRYSRETGIIDELLTENAKRNPLNSRSIWDHILWSICRKEQNLTLYLNTIGKEPYVSGKKIKWILAEQTTTGKIFRLKAEIFIDASGDGRIAYEAGADFRKGREGRDEFGEWMAPETPDEYTMGSTLYFLARDVGKPVSFEPPDWAYKFPSDDDLPGRHHEHFYSHETFWWVELGGLWDTISDAEKIRDELIRYIYGIWDHIKNHGDHGAETYALDWIGVIPGKRESRRFIGDYTLTQGDIESLKIFQDAIAYTGWPIDLHPPQGILGRQPPTRMLFLQGRPTIPFRCIYSRNILNLLLAGRDISVSHVALGTTRLIATCAIIGQAAGTAAFLCIKYGTTPRDVGKRHIHELQQLLLKQDCYIPHVKNEDPTDLARLANVSASSEAMLHPPEKVDEFKHLDRRRAQSFVLSESQLESISLYLKNKNPEPTKVLLRLRRGVFIDDFRSKEDIAAMKVSVPPGEQWVNFNLNLSIGPNNPYWVLLEPAANIFWGFSREEPVGTQAGSWDKLGNFEDCPYGLKRHRGTYLFRVSPESRPYGPKQVLSGMSRPERTTNLWMSDPEKSFPQWIELKWSRKMEFNTIYLTFDNNLDRPLWGYYGVAPELVRDYRLLVKIDEGWRELVKVEGNYRRRNIVRFETIKTDTLRVEISATNGDRSARVYEIRVYKED